MMQGVRSLFRLYLEKKKWRAENQHNHTAMGQMFNRALVHVGKDTYGQLNVINHSDCYKLNIGNFCSIAPEVLFVVCGEHAPDKISTYPFSVRYGGKKYEAISKGDIKVQDDVWIGVRSTILSGVTIGQGAVIAAVGVCNPIMTMMLLFMNGLCIGAGILMGMQYGAKDYETLHRQISTTMIAGIIFAAIISGLGAVFSPQILRLLQIDEKI